MLRMTASLLQNAPVGFGRQALFACRRCPGAAPAPARWGWIDDASGSLAPTAPIEAANGANDPERAGAGHPGWPAPLSAGAWVPLTAPVGADPPALERACCGSIARTTSLRP